MNYFKLLQENGDFLLQENGDKILLENVVYDTRDTKIHGVSTTQDNRNVKIKGQLSTSDTRASKIKGGTLTTTYTVRTGLYKIKQHESTIKWNMSLNAVTTGDEQNNEPEYKTVAFIKLKSLSAGGAFLLNML